MTNMSTIVVKADVHMTENNSRCDLHKSSLSNKVQSNKKTNKLDFSQMDDIRIIESESVNILSDNKKQQNKQRYKHRWSLRIKLQTYENENTSPGILNLSIISNLLHKKRNIYDEKNVWESPKL